MRAHEAGADEADDDRANEDPANDDHAAEERPAKNAVAEPSRAEPSFMPASPSNLPNLPTRPEIPYRQLASYASTTYGGTNDAGTRRPSRAKRIATVAVTALVVAAAAIVAVVLLNKHTPGAQQTGTGTARNTDSSQSAPGPVRALNDPTSALPAGWTTETIPASQDGTTAGFSIGLPDTWVPKPDGLATYLYAPSGATYMDVDLTQSEDTNMVAEANYIAKNAVAEGHLPGYKQIAIDPVTIRGTAGAYWAFTWQTTAGVTMRVDDLLFVLDGQSYALDFSTPNADFNGSGAGLTMFEQMLRTFQPLQG